MLFLPTVAPFNFKSLSFTTCDLIGYVRIVFTSRFGSTDSSHRTPSCTVTLLLSNEDATFAQSSDGARCACGVALGLHHVQRMVSDKIR